ncbi:MAG: hypothetical protein ABSF35_15905 [Polyangia bacterium]|jgi:hypothetical protein
MTSSTADQRYLQTLIDPIRVCASYKPKMGQGVNAGLSLEEFQALYRADPFYAWYGLDHPMMYAAHKAAGGMTSVYRQIGIGVERLFRLLLQDHLGLSVAESEWSYETKSSGGKSRTLHLDGRIELDAVSDPAARRRVKGWMNAAAVELGVAAAVRRSLKGAVFEVRQGYKSKDSKRQNADIANASTAYTRAYLPCVVVLSTQIDTDIVTRYRNEQWAILIGSVTEPSPILSTYSFIREVVGFDLTSFFSRNSSTLRTEVDRVLHALLSP